MTTTMGAFDTRETSPLFDAASTKSRSLMLAMAKRQSRGTITTYDHLDKASLEMHARRIGVQDSNVHCDPGYRS